MKKILFYVKEINVVDRYKCNVELVSRLECLRTREEYKEVQYKK